MIKLICFDLDGVLVSTKELHFEALNEALVESGFQPISKEDHLNKFDGLSTLEKLKLLGITDPNISKQIDDLKQDKTAKLIEGIVVDPKITDTIKELIKQNYKICVVSNATELTVIKCLKKLEILELVDYYHAAKKPKPNGYLFTMHFFSVGPQETLIIEDSPKGLMAAQKSGAHILQVKSPDDINLDLILNKIKEIDSKCDKQEQLIWRDESINLVIPMAGNGQRFVDAGYNAPKPFIKISGKCMIELVHKNLSVYCNTILITKPNAFSYYSTIKNSIINNSKKLNFIETKTTTEGAACTILLADYLIDNDKPLLIANSDQYVDWNEIYNMANFLYGVNSKNVDGGMITFESDHPKWSYAKTKDGLVTKVKEKVVISNEATVGIYYWKKGSDFVKYARQMIEQNDRHNNEFYVCPVFNYAIKDGKKFTTYKIPKELMFGLGTPEDLTKFLESDVYEKACI